MDVHNEILGVSDGTPGQRFQLTSTPVVRTDEPFVVEVSDVDGWVEWSEAKSFAESGPDDLHWRLDAHEGVVAFGPAVRDVDGSIRQYGAVPPPDARIRLRSYRVGGGRHGNVARGAIVTLRSALPFVATVTNRHPARGGLDAETAANARERGPLVVGTRDRAVTLADYEYLTTRASGRVARAKALEVGDDGRPATPGEGTGVKVLVVPTVGSFEATGEFRFEQLVPGAALLEDIQTYLSERRMVGSRVMVGPSLYSGISIAAEVHLRPDAHAAKVELACLQALYTYLSPLTGGPDGEGWPYGRPLNVGEVYGALQNVDGVLYVEGARMFPVNPLSGDREAATDRLELSPDSLIFGRGHSIRVLEAD
jgi:predicted phage baseplate assembly protein